MRRLLQRVRGAIGLGLTWAVACSAVGAFIRWVFDVNLDAPLPLIFGVFGFVAGVTFSALLVLAQGRRRFDQMSLSRFAALGALGGLLLAVLFAKVVVGWDEVVVIGPAFSIASAICASGSLALARRAERRELTGAPRETVTS